jgi:putative SOS response-associated peptidase YedK
VCGRFGLFVTPEVLEEYFALAEPAGMALSARYNLTPGQAVAAVREHDGRRRLDALTWGLVPFWAKDAAIGRRLINARLEGIDEKPAFREAWARRRCLIPASGFYEWGEAEGGGKRARKRPYFIAPVQEPALALAGLWERWRTPAGDRLETCVVVTVEASPDLAAIHDRMPLLVPRRAHATWLDPRTIPADVAELARESPALEIRRVGLRVNDPRNDDETLIAPVEDGLLGNE